MLIANILIRFENYEQDCLIKSVNAVAKTPSERLNIWKSRAVFFVVVVVVVILVRVAFT